MTRKDNKAQLEDLRKRLAPFLGGRPDEPVSAAHLEVIATILNELILVTQSHIYHKDDPAYPDV